MSTEIGKIFMQQYLLTSATETMWWAGRHPPLHHDLPTEGCLRELSTTPDQGIMRSGYS